MGTSVSFQVECVVESFAAEGAQITFDLAVAFDMSVEHALERKFLVAHAAYKLVRISLHT